MGRIRIPRKKIFSRKGIIITVVLFLSGLVAFLANSATILNYIGFPNAQSVLHTMLINKASPTSSPKEQLPFEKRFDFDKENPATILVGWKTAGGLPAPYTPRVELINQTNKALVCPKIDKEIEPDNNYSKMNNILYNDNLVIIPPFTITTKLSFRTDGDNAGILFGLNTPEDKLNMDNSFAVLANTHYHNDINHPTFEIWQNISGKLYPIRTPGLPKSPEDLQLQKDYWLRIIAEKDTTSNQTYNILAQLSKDNNNWELVDHREGLTKSELSGKIGLMTTGVHHPEVYFYNLDIKKMK